MREEARSVTEVQIVFKTHLDLGFTDFADTVQKAYFQEFIPRAIQTAATLRRIGAEQGREERFIWTTGSWLLYTYLEQASPQERAALDAAILAGDIRWHALPFTMHSELVDASLFRYGLSLSQRLDRRFGTTTVAAKMTDVPGHTRAIVPLLAEAGVRLLHIGINDASTAPDVPDLFVWRDEHSGTKVMVMYHKAGYGGTQVVPALNEAFAVEHTLDNQQPPSLQSVRHTYLRLQHRFPNAILRAATLETFADHLAPYQAALPIITQEIGDTWIHGVGSDPQRVSHYRELSRLRRRWMRQGRIQEGDAAYEGLSQHLLLIAEHTWGMDTKLFLAEPLLDNEEFHQARQTLRYRRYASSWEEQRAYLHSAIAALADTPVGDEANHVVALLKPSKPLTADEPTNLSVDNHPLEVATPHFLVTLDAATGALIRCQERATQREWASAQQRLGSLSYQTFAHSDYERFFREYIRLTEEGAWWMEQDYRKPGMESTVAQSRRVSPRPPCSKWTKTNAKERGEALPRFMTYFIGIFPYDQCSYPFILQDRMRAV